MAKSSKSAGLEQFKMEAAREVGVNLGQGYNLQQSRQVQSAVRWLRR